MTTQTNAGLSHQLAEMGRIEAPRLISPEFTITLQFDAESRVHGASACNRYFSAFHVNGPQMSFQQIASTRMMCQEPAMALESDYFAALEHVETYQLLADTLILTYEQGKRHLLFRYEATA